MLFLPDEHSKANNVDSEGEFLVFAISFAFAVIVLIAVLLMASPANACDRSEAGSWVCGAFKNTAKTYKRKRHSRPMTVGKISHTRTTKIAARYIGRNPTGRRTLWCADFVNMVERKAGRRGTRSRMARSFLRYGRRVSNPRPGDIAIFARGRRGGHVAYVVGTRPGYVKIIGGNQCGRRGARRVCTAWYPKRRAIGYRRI